MTQVCRGLALVLLATVFVGLATPGALQAEPTSPLEITPNADGISLIWRLPPSSLARFGTQSALSDADIGGVRLPTKLVAVHLADDLPVVPHIDQLESMPWDGEVRAVDSLIPQTITGEPRPALAMHTARALPESPVVVLREGRMRGTRIVVLAISPIFAAGGQTSCAVC